MLLGLSYQIMRRKFWKNLKVKNYLFQAKDRTMLETILKKGTSKEIWDSLKQKYQGTARVKRAQLLTL
ncbi:hypothetical protein CR513_02349, partial [Mucuna pruriens]